MTENIISADFQGGEAEGRVEEETDEYVSVLSNLQVGDIVVARRVLPSRDFTFYQIVSLVQRSRTPRVRQLRVDSTLLQNEITYRSCKLVPRANDFCSELRDGTDNRPKALSVNASGQYRAKDSFGNATELERYNPQYSYVSEWYDS